MPGSLSARTRPKCGWAVRPSVLGPLVCPCPDDGQGAEHASLCLSVLPSEFTHAWPKLLPMVLGGIAGLVLFTVCCAFCVKCWHRRVSEPSPTSSRPHGTLKTLRLVRPRGCPVSVTCFSSGSLCPPLPPSLLAGPRPRSHEEGEKGRRRVNSGTDGLLGHSPGLSPPSFPFRPAPPA